jgi:hypothetical protein
MPASGSAGRRLGRAGNGDSLREAHELGLGETKRCGNLDQDLVPGRVGKDQPLVPGRRGPAFGQP